MRVSRDETAMLDRVMLSTSQRDATCLARQSPTNPPPRRRRRRCNSFLDAHYWATVGRAARSSLCGRGVRGRESIVLRVYLTRHANIAR